jgi:hypothetical protein
MGKTDQWQSKKRSCKAPSKSKHKSTDGDSKHKKQPSFDATKFEATNDDCHRHSKWRYQFQLLCDFKVQFGHCAVPKRYSANPKLGKWVSKQRHNSQLYHKGKPSTMTAERLRALDVVGFDWGTTKADLVSLWNERFQELREFKAQFGHCNVPRIYSGNPQLAQWVSNQRRKTKSSEETQCPMRTERNRALVGIGFDWGERKPNVASIWSVRCQELREFKAQFGHCVVPKRYSANLTLANWVATQRGNYKKNTEGKLSPMTVERFRELDGIGFEWKAQTISCVKKSCNSSAVVQGREA